MKDRRRIIALIVVMASVSLAIVGLTLYLLYDVALEQQRVRLVEIVHSQARLIESVARFESQHSPQDHPGSWEAETLAQVLEAHESDRGLGNVCEFFLFERDGDAIVPLRSVATEHLDPIPADSPSAAFARRALAGEAGVRIATDHRGVWVLAAYEPVSGLDWGLVAQIELGELRSPFVNAGAIAALAAIFLVAAGAGTALRLSSPLLTRLRVSEARYRGIVETAVDAIITIDDEGTIVTVNPACEKVFGYSERELLGRNVTLLMPEPYQSEYQNYLAEYLRTGERRIIGTIGREAEARRKDGTMFPVELSVSEVRIGKHRLFTGMLRDVTERKKAIEALEIKDQAIASSITAIAIGDLEGRISFANRAFLDLWGFDREEEILGRINTELTAEPEKVRDIMEAVRTRGAWTGESVARRKDGTHIDVMLTATLVRNASGEPVHVMATFIDVTEHKAAEKKLIEQESLAKLGEMAAIVAHEVKNPLAGIIGAGRMLGRNLPEGSTEREIAEELAARAESLNDSVRDILAYSRPQTPVPRAVSVKALLEGVFALVSEDPLFDGIELRLDAPGTEVLCDDEMLKPVLLNLLMNAAEAMEGKGSVRVSAETTSGDDGLCRIRLRDTGPGIPVDRREKIFEPFFTTKGAGTGLGLPLARRVVELHGGRIEVDCPAEGGTEILVEIPRAPAESSLTR